MSGTEDYRDPLAGGLTQLGYSAMAARVRSGEIGLATVGNMVVGPVTFCEHLVDLFIEALCQVGCDVCTVYIDKLLAKKAVPIIQGSPALAQATEEGKHG